MSVIRRHVLGMKDTSPWAMLGQAVRRVLRFAARLALYTLRLFLDPPGTCAGVRRAILAATQLPEAEPSELPAKAPPRTVPRRCTVSIQEHGVHCGNPLPCPDHPKPRHERRQDHTNGGTKTAHLLALVRERHGELAAIPLDQASKIATALAPEVDLHPASARTALLGAVRAALPAGGSDSR